MLALLEKYPNLHAIAFDGTISHLPETAKNSSRLTFVRKNVGSIENDVTTNLHCHIQDFDNVFLKMDVEGHEFRCLPTLIGKHMHRIKQLVLEVHSPGDIALHPNYFTGLWDIKHDFMIRLLEQINETHTLVHLHPNNGCETHVVDGVVLPNVFECTFVRNDFADRSRLQKNSRDLPTSIDQPNVPSKPVYVFDSYPFVATK